ncbi:unnamed protein product [Schistocephalus solidus]|uniref:Reverse transcriptase domain-containing protein n=1 Tax=Schistocephalus solidus TaxID=70667 RepID=A0A183TSP5_SCHSO|nr:unnamed protein product [Schistocephalus solidus]
MVSFDVTSSFTSIPQILAIETVGDLLENCYDEVINKPKRAHLIQLLTFCLKTYFTLEGTGYQQTKGTLMGSPLSGFIAEAVLKKLETRVFTNHRPIFWMRYVDDTFVLLKFEMVAEFHALLNSIYLDIHFTMEAEANSQMAFLDVLVHRKTDGSLRTTVYRKAINTRQVLSYQSKHPLCRKRSCERTLYQRAETHCSEKGDKAAELHYFKRMFTSNGYPRSFIERSRQLRQVIRPLIEPPKVWRAMPHIKNVSKAVARLFQPLEIGVAHKPEATIRRLVMRPMTPLSRGKSANVIYHVHCGSCEAKYFGETGKRLQTRMNEHERAVRRMDQLSLVTEHCAASGGTFSFQDAEILGQRIDQTARETHEAWHTEPSSINRCPILLAAFQALRGPYRPACPGQQTRAMQTRSMTLAIPIQHPGEAREKNNQ